MDFIDEYIKLLKKIDDISSAVTKDLPFIPCRKHCADCCMQIFPLSFIESYYINSGFRNLERKKRRILLKSAKKLEEKLLKNPFSNEKIFYGTKEEMLKKQQEFASYLRGTDLVCPYLNKEKLCEFYNFRPHDCRIHGLSYDKLKSEILGCFRFNGINEFKNPGIREKLIDSNFMYPEIHTLDEALINSVCGNISDTHIWYYASPLQPVLKDYENEDWEKIFDIDQYKAGLKGNYALVLDC